MNAIRILLSESIDYAGLFPPAGLDMPTAVRNYAEYRRSPEAWALGRFVVPVSRLGEFETAAAAHLHQAARPWQLSVLAGANLSSDLAIITEFSSRYSGVVAADSLETKASSTEAIQDTMLQLPQDVQAFIEVPIDRDPRALLTSIARLGGKAKVRTGGVTDDAFPGTAELLRFIRGCVEAGVPFKATAGLHHPLRAEYRLTYEPNSRTAAMFGFLNLLLATALLRAGAEGPIVSDALEEGSPGAIRVDGDGIGWQNYRFDDAALRLLRKEGMVSFGSCSFTEPLSDLQGLHLLPPRVQPA